MENLINTYRAHKVSAPSTCRRLFPARNHLVGAFVLKGGEGVAVDERQLMAFLKELAEIQAELKSEIRSLRDVMEGRAVEESRRPELRVIDGGLEC